MNSNRQNTNFLKKFFWAIIAVILVWLITFTLFIYIPAPEWLPIGDRGTFGDMFGGLNTLFSGFAFAGIIISILIQQKELEQTNKELGIQNFDRTFFSLLTAFNEIINSLSHTREEYIENKLQYSVDKTFPYNLSPGRWHFKYYYEILNRIMKGEGSIDHTLETAYDEQEMGDSARQHQYEKFWAIFRGQLGHYFRTLYNIIKIIDLSKVADKDKYSSILRAQLSDYELVLLFYNCLTPRGKKLRAYVIKYNLIKHISLDLLASREDAYIYYPELFDRTPEADEEPQV